MEVKMKMCYLTMNYMNKDTILKEQMPGWIVIEHNSIGSKRL